MGRLSGSTRIRILERDGFRCVYCGRKPPEVALEVDHVLPLAKGGNSHSTNLVTACRECNNGKRAGLVALPEGVVPQALPSKLERRIAHLHEIEKSFAARSAVAEPDAEPKNRRLVRAACDLCTHRADTVHFVPWISRCHEVLFACSAHDPGGYWALIETFDVGEYTTRQHLETKYDAWLPLALLTERLNGRKPRIGIEVNWRASGGTEIVRRWA